MHPGVKTKATLLERNARVKNKKEQIKMMKSLKKFEKENDRCLRKIRQECAESVWLAYSCIKDDEKNKSLSKVDSQFLQLKGQGAEIPKYISKGISRSRTPSFEDGALWDVLPADMMFYIDSYSYQGDKPKRIRPSYRFEYNRKVQLCRKNLLPPVKSLVRVESERIEPSISLETREKENRIIWKNKIDKLFDSWEDIDQTSMKRKTNIQEKDINMTKVSLATTKTHKTVTFVDQNGDDAHHNHHRFLKDYISKYSWIFVGNEADQEFKRHGHLKPITKQDKKTQERNTRILKSV